MSSFVSINPATGKRLERYPQHTKSQIDAALTRAQGAFGSWQESSFATRVKVLRSLAATLRRERDALAVLITAEMGKPLAQSRGEIEKCALCCDFYARHGKNFFSPEKPVEAPAKSQVQFAPLGVLLAIMPWNFPFWQAFRAAVPALLAGNAVLLKHSSNVSGCALAIETAFKRAGFPRGLFQTLLVSSATIPALIADPRIQAITLTGSTAAGKSVATAAGAFLKPCVFELGGSDPYLILDDADLDHAAEVCAAGRLVNTGQSCVAAKRFIVTAKVRAAFEEKFIARMAARRLGDPNEPDTEIGPLAREDLRDELHAQVVASVKAGARLRLGGEIPKRVGSFYPATVLTEVKPRCPAYSEELFGPVAAVISARDEAQAVQIANDSIYGLGSAVFTSSPARARRAVAALQAGMVFINESVRSEVSLPFGGTKQSGYGRELGVWGARSFVNVKTVVGST